jgi:hypothetical protein
VHSFFHILVVAALLPIGGPMVGLATAMFIGLFAFGHELLGWGGAPSDKVQLGLFVAFILGIVCGYKTKG